MSARDNRSMNERHNEIVEELKANSMTTKEATARPWGLAKDGQHNHLVHVVARSGEDWIADCDCLNGLSRDECEANAQLIVTAVNSHSTLTEENARLLQENKAMREALKPFADLEDSFSESYRDETQLEVEVSGDGHSTYSFTLGDLRRARAILTQGEGK